MKRILLATTALVSFGGVASAAEINLTGYAEIGIFDGDATGIDTQFHNDWQVDFRFSGETDGGLTFGGRVQLEENNESSNVNGTPRIDEESFFVSGAFGRVTLGETDGAYNWGLGFIYSGTSLRDDHSSHAGAYWFTGLDGYYDDQVARYEYSFGDFGIAGSLELDDSNSKAKNGGEGDPIIGVGGKWASTINGMDLALGLGFQDNNDYTLYGVSGSIALPMGLSVAAGYAELDGIDTHFASSNGFSATADSWYGVSVAYQTGPLLVSANYGAYDTESINGTATSSDLEGFGLVANYDLGGGAVVMAGYGYSDVPDSLGNIGSFNSNGQETWSLGLGMSF